MRKSGYQTTEFWFTLVSFIFSGLYLVGLINDNDQKEELISTVSHAVESCILIGGQFAIFYRYILSRKQEKIEYEKTKQKEADLIAEELEQYVGVEKNHSRININTASIAELIQLPHIGPNTAKNIIEYRNTHGRIKSVKELVKINGIGDAVLKDIKKYIVLK